VCTLGGLATRVWRVGIASVFVFIALNVLAREVGNARAMPEYAQPGAQEILAVMGYWMIAALWAGIGIGLLNKEKPEPKPLRPS